MAVAIEGGYESQISNLISHWILWITSRHTLRENMHIDNEKTAARTTINIKVQENKTTEGIDEQVKNFCKSIFAVKSGP